MYGYSYNIEIDGKIMIIEADIDHIVFKSYKKDK